MNQIAVKKKATRNRNRNRITSSDSDSDIDKCNRSGTERNEDAVDEIL